jgi:hypothetical protein
MAATEKITLDELAERMEMLNEGLCNFGPVLKTILSEESMRYFDNAIGDLEGVISDIDAQIPEEE